MAMVCLRRVFCGMVSSFALMDIVFASGMRYRRVLHSSLEKFKPNPYTCPPRTRQPGAILRVVPFHHVDVHDMSFGWLPYPVRIARPTRKQPVFGLSQFHNDRSRWIVVPFPVNSRIRLRGIEGTRRLTFAVTVVCCLEEEFILESKLEMCTIQILGP
jgi:hypothetical protein